MVRKRLYEVNKFATTNLRRNYARRMIREIDDLLEEGYYIDVNRAVETEPEKKERFTLKEAIDYALEIKKATIRGTSYPSYKSAVKVFKEWADENKIGKMDIGNFDKLRAIYFDDYMVIDRGYSAKTINGNISYLKSTFMVLVEREIIKDNPFARIRKHKEAASRKNLAFSPTQIAEIKKIVESKDPQLWLFIQFIYYCFMRPNEIRQMKFSNIHLEEKQIFIPRHISKNGLDGYVTIPENLYDQMKSSTVYNHPGEYLFQGRDGKRPVSKNVMGRRFKLLIEDLNLGSDYTLYSWKHSGVVAAYNAGVDIKTIQSQCRHQSLEQTDIYLKSLGLGINKAINKIPEL